MTFNIPDVHCIYESMMKPTRMNAELVKTVFGKVAKQNQLV